MEISESVIVANDFRVCVSEAWFTSVIDVDEQQIADRNNFNVSGLARKRSNPDPLHPKQTSYTLYGLG